MYVRVYICVRNNLLYNNRMSSKTFSIRLEDAVLDEVRRIAKKEHRATSAQIAVPVEKGLAGYRKEQEYLNRHAREE